MKICEYMNNTMEIYAFNNMIALDYLIEVSKPEHVDNWDTDLQWIIIFTDVTVNVTRKIKIKLAKNATFDIFTMNGLLNIGITTAKNLEIENQFVLYIKEAGK